jgi:transcriptional regulator with XRE-family HTH domain
MSERPDPTGDPVEVGLVVRARRLDLGMTQQRLAFAAGVSLPTVRNVETGARRHYRALTRHGLCRALGWPPQALNALSADNEPDLPPDGGQGAPNDNDIELLAAFSGTLARLTPAERAQVLDFARRIADDTHPE